MVTITKFSSEEKVIELANDTMYGLATAIHTKNNERSVRMTNALKPVQRGSVVSDPVPFALLLGPSAFRQRWISCVSLEASSHSGLVKLLSLVPTG